MKKIISLIISVSILFATLNIKYPLLIAAEDMEKYENIQVNVLLNNNNGKKYTLNAVNCNNQILVSIDDIKLLTQSDKVEKINSTDYIIVKGKKSIFISSNSNCININIQYEQQKDSINHFMETQPAVIDSVLYVPFEDLLVWLDAEYEIYDYYVKVIPHKITLIDYIDSEELFGKEYFESVFNFESEIGMNYEQFIEIGNMADIVNSIYDAASVDLYRWFKIIDRPLGAITSVNTALRDFYSRVIRVMMSNSEEDNDYINEIVGRNFVDNINNINAYRNYSSLGYNEIKYYSYDIHFDKYKNLYEHLDEAEEELRKLGYGREEIIEAFRNQMLKTNVTKGGIITESITSNDYISSINAHFDFKFFGKFMDIANSAGTTITSSINAFDELREHFNKSAKKIMFIDNVFVSSKNVTELPKELRQASSKEVKKYKDQFSKDTSNFFVTGLYGATKDGQIYDWISMVTRGKISQAINKVAVLNTFSTLLQEINFANYKNVQDSVNGILCTYASHLIELESLREFNRRKKDWNLDINNYSKFEDLRAPLITTLLSSEVSYRSMKEYYVKTTHNIPRDKREKAISYIDDRIHECIRLIHYIENLL